MPAPGAIPSDLDGHPGSPTNGAIGPDHHRQATGEPLNNFAQNRANPCLAAPFVPAAEDAFNP